MNVSIVANVINVAGSCVGVFILHLGAAGVAWPSLLSRMLSAAAVTAYCFRKQNPVRYRRADIWAWDGGILKKVMGIALPNGVAQSIWSLASIMGLAMAPVYTTVIGQCMGARHGGGGMGIGLLGVLAAKDLDAGSTEQDAGGENARLSGKKSVKKWGGAALYADKKD